MYLDVSFWRTGGKCWLSFCTIVLELTSWLGQREKFQAKVTVLKDWNLGHHEKLWRVCQGQVIFLRISRIKIGPMSSNPYLVILFFFLFFFCFYCNIVDLQWCVSFRYTEKWFSYTYTCIYFFQILFPFRLLQIIGCHSLCCIVGPYLLFILYIVVY